MRRLILFALLALGGSVALFGQASGNAGWVNNQQGCWCGYQTSLVRPYKVVGKYTTLADRQYVSEVLAEWNKVATLFTVDVPTTEQLGAPGNGVNELNVLINSAESTSIYGFDMATNLYGRAVIEPDASFGQFNECKDFSSAGCGPFTQTDVVMNAGFGSGWSSDWFNDGGGSALMQTTAIHEVGHTLGLHHVFTLPAWGDSFSTMNYANDDSMKWITRMDAKTIRTQYNTRVNSYTDVGVFPFTYGNAQYGETYASLNSSSVQPGGSLTLNNWLIQNIGTATASNVVVTFYLWPQGSRQYPQASDYAIGTATYATLPTDSEQDVSGTPLTVPQNVPEGAYFFGAIVTVNGAEDSTFVAGKYTNNRFILGHATRTVVNVGSGGGGCSDATSLTSGVPVNDSVQMGYAQFYCISVPSGATSLTVTTTNAPNDVDLYVRYGAKPTGSDYDCRPYTSSGNETCSFNNPNAGVWYIAVDGSWAASTYTLTATYTGGATCTLSCTATVPATGTAGSAVSFSSTATPANCTGSPTYAWTFGDGGTSTSQNPTHTYVSASTYSWSLTVSVNGQTCTRSGSITINAAQTCSVTCTATVPATGTAGSAVSFSSTATPANCTGSPTYSWTFGDGGTSTSQNSTHAYVSAGTYSWGFMVSVDGQTCTRSGSITISGGGGGRKAGDCDGNGTVTASEVQQVVSNQLGATATGCGDCNGDGTVSITEIQKAVNCQLGLPNCDSACQN